MIDRSFAKQANERGLRFARQEEYEAAEGAFREALRADLSYAAAHNNLGLVLLGRNHFYEAALEFSFAGQLDRTAVEPVLNLARLYEAVGWHKAALEQCEKALGIDPNNAQAVERLARVRMISGADARPSHVLWEGLVQSEKSTKWDLLAEAQRRETVQERGKVNGKSYE